MYKVASDKRQTGLHRGRPSDWVNGEEVQSEVDRWRNLKSAIQNLDDRIQSMPKGSAERKAAGLQKLQWQDELKAMRPKIKAGNLDNLTFQNCFIEVAREQLMPALYQSMMAAAKRLHDQKRAQAQKLRTPTE